MQFDVSQSFEIYLFSAVIGLIVGSFLSMLTWRLPRLMLEGESDILKKLSIGGSKCPKCGTQIPWYRLIPVFSWLLSKGKCHHCEASISPRYPIIELFTASLTVACIWHFGANTMGFISVLFSWILISIFIIDFEHQLILDNLSLPLLWLGLIVNTQNTFTTPTDAIIGAAVGYLILWTVFHIFKLITGKEGMGYGDFKLLAALGAWFGLLAIPQIILIAALSSISIMLTAIILKQRSKDTPMAFGPFLTIGGWSCLFFGTNIFI